MLEKLLVPVVGAIVAVISAGGYAAVALLMAIESACVPLPSEVIMPFAGYLVSRGELSLWGVALAGAIGCNLGSVLAYEVGKRGGRPLALRWGRYVLVDAADLDRADRFFAAYGGAAVFIARVLPLVRSFIALPAGIARMKLVPFHLYTFAGSFIWCLALAWVGRTLGDHWRDDPRLAALLHRFDLVILVALVLGAAWFAWRKLGARRGA